MKKILTIPLAFAACLLMFVFAATFALSALTALPANATETTGTTIETVSPIVTTSTTTAPCAVLESEAAFAALTIDVKQIIGAATFGEYYYTKRIGTDAPTFTAFTADKDISTMAQYAVALGKIDAGTTSAYSAVMRTSPVAEAFVAVA